MFTKRTLTTVLISTLILCGCGKDGAPGNAFLALDWDWYVDGYNDNNPDLPSTVSRNFNYSTGTGTFQCEYACSDGIGNFWYWEYEYTITVKKGEDGKLFRSGADGKDLHHKMFLNGTSTPSFSAKEKSFSKSKTKELKPFTLNTDDFTKVYIGDPIIEEHSANGYTTIVKRRMFKLQ